MSNAVVSKTLVEFTVEDCIQLYEAGYRAVCNDGRLDGFIKDSDQTGKFEFIWLNTSR